MLLRLVEVELVSIVRFKIATIREIKGLTVPQNRADLPRAEVSAQQQLSRPQDQTHASRPLR